MKWGFIEEVPEKGSLSRAKKPIKAYQIAGMGFLAIWTIEGERIRRRAHMESGVSPNLFLSNYADNIDSMQWDPLTLKMLSKLPGVKTFIIKYIDQSITIGKGMIRDLELMRRQLVNLPGK